MRLIINKRTTTTTLSESSYISDPSLVSPTLIEPLLRTLDSSRGKGNYVVLAATEYAILIKWYNTRTGKYSYDTLNGRATDFEHDILIKNGVAMYSSSIYEDIPISVGSEYIDVNTIRKATTDAITDYTEFVNDTIDTLEKFNRALKIDKSSSIKVDNDTNK